MRATIRFPGLVARCRRRILTAGLALRGARVGSRAPLFPLVAAIGFAMTLSANSPQMVMPMSMPSRSPSVGVCSLVSICGVRSGLPEFQLDSQRIIGLAEGHYLAPTFDIGSEGRRLLRFLPSALVFFKNCSGQRTRRLLWPEVAEELFHGRNLC